MNERDLLTYRAAEESLAVADRSDRLRLRIIGAERVRFLQNLTTNDIRRLEPGLGCETFITSPPGKTLGHVTVHVTEEFLLLRSEGVAKASLEPHFAKYGVFEDVAFEDVTSSTWELHLVGPRLLSWWEGTPFGIAFPDLDLGVFSDDLGEHRIVIIPERPTGRPGLTLIGAREAREAIELKLHLPGTRRPIEKLTTDAFEAMRIEAGTPVFGRDVTTDNLPQEIGRDSRAISFTKGCYLGQETVARIDALGHVNKMLRGLRFDSGPVPPAGVNLLAEGVPRGVVTSSAESPRLGGPIGLGYVRRTHASIGTRLDLEVEGSIRSATVVDLPMF